MSKKLIERVRRKIRNHEKYYITIHDERWKNKMIKLALEIMDDEKDKQFIELIDKELFKLKPCATTRISVLKDLRSKIK